MTRSSISKPLYRFAADLVLGFGFFVLLAIAVAGTARLTQVASGVAHAGGLVQALQDSDIVAGPSLVQPATVALAPPPHAKRPDAGSVVAFAVLATVFALMFAFNLAFFRHLRTAYASPRGAKRRWAKWSARRPQA